MVDLCPVCGLPLDAPAWAADRASFEICACCGTHFGYDDACGGDASTRRTWWQKARQRWVAGGMRWCGSGRPPAGWDPTEQLARVADPDPGAAPDRGR
jgi:hypothetical protein